MIAPLNANLVIAQSLCYMAHVVDGYLSFTCHSPTRSCTSGVNQVYICFPNRGTQKLVYIYRPRRDGRLSWLRHHNSK